MLHQAETATVQRHSTSVRVAMAMCCAEQHAIPQSTAQHPCALEHNASQV